MNSAKDAAMNGAPVGESEGDMSGEKGMAGGRRGRTVKTLKRLLKKAGLKTSGRKAALTRRAKKARIVRGGAEEEPEEAPMGGRRKRKGSRKMFKLF
jgi:hypothetical protein